MVVVFKVLEALVTSRFLKRKNTPNTKFQSAEAAAERATSMSCTNTTLSQSPECLPGHTRTLVSRLGCHLGGHGLPVVADKSPESRSPCACGQLLPTPAILLYNSQDHLGSQTRDSRAGLGLGGCRLSMRLQNSREGHWLVARGNQPDAGHMAEGVSRASPAVSGLVP